MTTPAPQQPPSQPIAELGPAGEALWARITAVYELSPAELEVLWQACATADLIDYAQAALEDAPLVVKGSVGQDRAHPLLSKVAEQRVTLARLLRELALPQPGEIEGVVRNPAKQAAAQARWRAQRRGSGGLGG